MQALSLPQRYAHKRVLLAEDDPDMRALIAMALRADGYEVAEARDGGEALELLRGAGMGGVAPAADLVVSDIQMPRVNGLELLERLRAGRVGIPVVLVSAFADTAVRCEARRLGAMLLDKPFDLGDLLAVVSEAMEVRR
jgi:DNA-binding response OmpR family regulator